MKKRSFNKCEPAVKENLYNQLIRSKLEYASTTWDPHNIVEEQKLEKIQKRAYKYIQSCIWGKEHPQLYFIS